MVWSEYLLLALLTAAAISVIWQTGHQMRSLQQAPAKPTVRTQNLARGGAWLCATVPSRPKPNNGPRRNSYCCLPSIPDKRRREYVPAGP